MSDRRAVKIKFLSKTPADKIAALWTPLLRGRGTLHGCQFTFDAADPVYDALVIYEDLPPLEGERKVMRRERLSCARDNTLLITTEPSSIRLDGPHYLRQFGYVWTNKAPALVRHPRQIRSTPPLRYFYGRNMGGGAHADIETQAPIKTRNLSIMSSKKAMAHTMHAKRLAFVTALKDRMGDDVDLFGRGFNPVDDKADAMRDYRYHIAIENHVERGHFTEKLTDCFLAGCLPFYFGDPDYAKIFPADAVIPIDIFDLDSAEQTIRHAIASHQFEARQTAIARSREIALSDFNTLDAAARMIATIYRPDAKVGGEILGRHAFRRAHPIAAARDALFVNWARRAKKASPLQN